MTKITTFENVEDWLEFRRAKVTGTKLKDIVTKRGNGTKIGVYQLIADQLAIEDNEDPMARGHRLEEEAIDLLTEQTGIPFVKDLSIISRDDNPQEAWSPDGYTKDLTIGVEVKCLRSALHIQAIIEDRIPDEYKEQSIQPFIACDELEMLYFAFYDPRVASNPLHVIEIKREDIEDDIKFYKEYQDKTLCFVNAWVEKLSW
jgi:hypothetical protein